MLTNKDHQIRVHNCLYEALCYSNDGVSSIKRYIEEGKCEAAELERLKEFLKEVQKMQELSNKLYDEYEKTYPKIIRRW